MGRREIELIKAETRRLEALGVVLGMLGLNVFEAKRRPRKSGTGPLHSHPRLGRKRVFQTNAEKQRAYRNRKPTLVSVTGVTK
ncbi:MAG: hypothetical protein ACREQ2_17075 [Candidatus Binatia bacterium]